MIRILVVEDDINIAKMIQTTIEIGGYSSVSCQDGIKALELINSNAFDLILLDVKLPVLSLVLRIILLSHLRQWNF